MATIVVAALLSLALAASARAATFIVTSPADSGAGSLRMAITGANTSDTIAFNIPGGGTPQINLGSTLPAIPAGVTINGGTQPGGWVWLNGPSSADAIDINAASVTLRGLVITGVASGAAINVTGHQNSVIAGNILGLTPTGALPAVANQINLLFSGGANNTAGGTTSADRNVISGASGMGVKVQSGATATIKGNYIGTDLTGLLPRPNLSGGVEFDSPNNTLGGTMAAARNVVSGNGGPGLTISGATASSETVVSNLIGVGADGTAHLGNQGGISFTAGATGNTVGGSFPNRINFNNVYGVSLLPGNYDLQDQISGNVGPGIKSTYTGGTLTITNSVITANNATDTLLITGPPGAPVTLDEYDATCSPNSDGNFFPQGDFFQHEGMTTIGSNGQVTVTEVVPLTGGFSHAAYTLSIFPGGQGPFISDCPQSPGSPGAPNAPGTTRDDPPVSIFAGPPPVCFPFSLDVVKEDIARLSAIDRRSSYQELQLRGLKQLRDQLIRDQPSGARSHGATSRGTGRSELATIAALGELAAKGKHKSRGLGRIHSLFAPIRSDCSPPKPPPTGKGGCYKRPNGTRGIKFPNPGAIMSVDPTHAHAGSVIHARLPCGLPAHAGFRDGNIVELVTKKSFFNNKPGVIGNVGWAPEIIVVSPWEIEIVIPPVGNNPITQIPAGTFVVSAITGSGKAFTTNAVTIS